MALLWSQQEEEGRGVEEVPLGTFYYTPQAPILISPRQEPRLEDLGREWEGFRVWACLSWVLRLLPMPSTTLKLQNGMFLESPTSKTTSA